MPGRGVFHAERSIESHELREKLLVPTRPLKMSMLESLK
jgi:hypothetical protein